MADQEEKAEETIELEGTDAGPKSKKKLIIIAIVVLILVGVAVAGTLYFLGAEDEEAAVDSDGKDNGSLVEGESGEGQGDSSDDAMAEGGSNEAQALYYALKPPYVVNIDARGRRRYLQAELTLLTREEETIAALEMHKPSLDHAINVLLSGHVFEDIRTAEGKELLRIELTKTLQDLLIDEIGKPGIEEVLFTNFVMQ